VISVGRLRGNVAMYERKRLRTSCGLLPQLAKADFGTYQRAGFSGALSLVTFRESWIKTKDASRTLFSHPAE
jgi:hypothetical protein